MPKKPLRSQDIRERNEKLVLRLIYTQDGISQSQVANITGLKPPTVFRIFTNLTDQGFIIECKTFQKLNDKKGRKPSFFCVNPDACYVIGVDFWLESAAVLIVDFSGRPVYKEVVKFEVGIKAEEMMNRIEVLMRNSILKSNVEEQKILGIGIGAPGVVNIEQGIVLKYPRAKGMTNYNIKKRISDSFAVPVYVHNNCSVIALSEYRYGKGKGQESMLAILIRGGVGGAFIQGGKPFVNQNKTTLEVGHLSVDLNGRICKCGARGCLETYLSENAILAELEAAGAKLTWQDLEKGLNNKEPTIIEVMNRLGGILSGAAYSLINVLNPEAVLIVSRYRFMSDFFVSMLQDSLEKLANVNHLNTIKVISEEYEPTIACKGAADLIIDNFFAAVESS